MKLTHRLHKSLPITALALALMGCDGVFNSIYDTPTPDSEIANAFSPVDGQRGRYTLSLKATDYSCWHFISLTHKSITTLPIPTSLNGEWDGKSGWTYHLVEGTKFTTLSSRPTDPQPEPEQWDIAIHHFDLRTNGLEAILTPFTDLRQLPPASHWAGAEFTPDIWANNQVITDLSQMMGYHIGYQNSLHNPVLSSLATMDFSSPPPTYASTPQVAVVRWPDGSMAAIRLASYMSQSGTKGFLTFDILYPYL